MWELQKVVRCYFHSECVSDTRFKLLNGELDYDPPKDSYAFQYYPRELVETDLGRYHFIDETMCVEFWVYCTNQINNVRDLMSSEKIPIIQDLS
jgi:hypothetical protein